MESLAALFVWYIKNGRAVQASHSMLAKVLAASLQKHSAFSAERPRIVRVETSERGGRGQGAWRQAALEAKCLSPS